MGLFNFTGKKPAFNPYNQIERIKFKAGSQMTPAKANEVLNQVRVKLSKVQQLVLDEARKDKTVTSEELREFARIDLDTMPPRLVLKAYKAMCALTQELKTKKDIPNQPKLTFKS